MKPQHFIILLSAIILSSCGEFIQPSYGPTKDLKVGNISGEEINISTKIYIENQNNYGFKVKTKKMGLYSNEKKIADIKIANKVKIKKDTGQDYPIKIQIKLLKGTSLLSLGTTSMLTNKPIKIGIKGKVKGYKFIFGKSVPIDFEKKVNPRQLMNLNGGGFGF